MKGHVFVSVFKILLLLIGCWLKSVTSLAKPLNRRDALTIGGASITGFVGISDNQAFAAEGPGASVGPIAILGASGRTGALCVIACLKRGLPVRALTRTGVWQVPPGEEASYETSPLLSVSACDVKDPVALEKGVKGCQAVIYAASSSKNGGNAKEIDNEGVAAAGDACLKASVGRYVILSSTAVTRPKSLGYIFTNAYQNIMGEKRKGEEQVMKEFLELSSSASSYTIIRPGGLEEPKLNKVLGPSTLEISQGDTLAGIISRADLAEVAAELAVSKAPNLRNTALELYYTNSAQACEGRFKKFLLNGQAPRLHGNSYAELFQGVQPNIDYYQL